MKNLKNDDDFDSYRRNWDLFKVLLAMNLVLMKLLLILVEIASSSTNPLSLGLKGREALTLLINAVFLGGTTEHRHALAPVLM